MPKRLIKLVKERRTAPESLVLIGLSLIPLFGVICFMRSKVLKHILAYPIFYSVYGITIWVGRRAYVLFSSNEPKLPSSSESESMNWAAVNWGSLIAAIIVGLTTLFFLHELFTHEMVRAFDAVYPDSKDD
jgi:hypothetical protein